MTILASIANSDRIEVDRSGDRERVVQSACWADVHLAMAPELRARDPRLDRESILRLGDPTLIRAVELANRAILATTT